MLNKSLRMILAVLSVPTLLLSAVPAVLFSPSPALAISDDANPWLAIENALCVAHRTVDYSALVGVPVRLETAAWTGAQNGLPTHCQLAGMIDGDEAFDFKVPMTWNGQVFPAGCNSGATKLDDSIAALSIGAISAFGDVSKRTVKLIRAISTKQRDVVFAGVHCD